MQAIEQLPLVPALVLPSQEPRTLGLWKIRETLNYGNVQCYDAT